jgi:hypothetical protein
MQTASGIVGLANLLKVVADSGGAPPVLSIRLEDGRIRLQFDAIAGNAYTVLFREDLATGSWARLVDVPAQVANGPVTVTDPVTATRYYKVVTPPAP